MEEMIALAVEKVGGTMLRAAVVWPHSPDVFAACKRAIDAGLILPIMIGQKQSTSAPEREAGQDLGKVSLIETETPAEALRAAIRMATAGEVDIIVRGGDAAPDFLRLLTAEGAGFVPRGGIASHVALIQPEKYEKAIVLTDALVIPQPDLKQKVALIENMLAVARQIGISAPRVAVLAAVEVVYPQMPVTQDAAILSKMGERGQIKGAYIDGPLSFDCAVDRFAAESKGIRTSEVAGQADAMLAPNMETAHGIYKAMALYGRAQLGGVIYGGRVPVAMPMASDSAETIFHSIALASVVR